MKTNKTQKDRADDIIIVSLEEYEELHSYVLCAALVGSLGITKEAVSNYVVKAFRKGLIRRGERRQKNGYMYRIASKNSEWGDGFQPEEQSPQRERQKRVSDIISSCKENSQIYQFDQLIRGCHGKCHAESPR